VISLVFLGVFFERLVVVKLEVFYFCSIGWFFDGGRSGWSDFGS